jgi:hypothetical protein
MRRIVIVSAALALLLGGCGAQDPEVTAPVDGDLGGEPEPAPDDPTTEPDPIEPAEPDDPALADPCADHRDRTDEAFVELLSPIDDEVVRDELQLIGCSNVPEATVSYRLLDGDGVTLAEGFTTAECGTGCVGAFAETVDLAAVLTEAGATDEPVVYVQVFWEDAADGAERGLTERLVILG